MTGPRGEAEFLRMAGDLGEMKGSLRSLVESLQGPHGVLSRIAKNESECDARFKEHDRRIGKLEGGTPKAKPLVLRISLGSGAAMVAGQLFHAPAALNGVSLGVFVLAVLMNAMYEKRG